MTFPVEQSAANTTQASNATNWGAQNMPSGIVAGDTLLAFVAVDGPNRVVTFTGGWTKLLDGATGSDGSVTLAIAYKKAVGSDTLSLTIDVAEQGACRVIRVDTAEDPDIQAPEIGAVTTGASSTPTVGLITPTGGAKDYKFYAVCAHDRNRTFTSAPTNHQANDGTLLPGGAVGAQVSWGDHDVNAATDDPDNFTYTTSDGFATVVVVVHPVVSGTLFFQNNEGALTFAGGLVRQTNKNVAGVLTFAGAIVKAISISVAGVLSFAGALVRQTRISVEGVLSFAGAVSATVVFIKDDLAGALSFAGGMVKQTQKNVAGTLTFDGAIGKLVSKQLAGTLSFTGTLATSFMTSQLVTGTLSFIGGLMTTFIPGGAGVTRRMWRSLWSRVWKDPGEIEKDN